MSLDTLNEHRMKEKVVGDHFWGNIKNCMYKNVTPYSTVLIHSTIENCYVFVGLTPPMWTLVDDIDLKCR